MESSECSKQTGCAEFMEIVELILDNEATPAQEQFAAQHLESCTGCFDHYEVEKQIKELIQKKLSNRPVPEGLAESIRAQIESLPQ